MKKILITALLLAGITATAQVKVGSNPTTIDTGTTNFQVEGTTTAEQFVVLKNGNVGIGTTTPSAKLDVRGSGTAFGSVAIQAVNTIDAAGEESWIRSYVQGANAGNPRMRFVVNGFTEWSAGIDNADDDKFKITNSSDVTGSSGFVILKTGNVGIGTATPAEKLVVANNIDGKLQVVVQNPSVNANAFAEVKVNSGTVDTYIGSTNVNAGFGSVWDGRGYINNNTHNQGLNIMASGNNSNLQFYTGGSNASNERMRIDANGNVGIGTTTPTGKLSISHSGTDATPSIQFNTASNIGYVNFRDADALIGNKTSNPLYLTTDDQVRIAITGAGNVGIGTTTPAYQLSLGVTSGESTLALGGNTTSARAMVISKDYDTFESKFIFSNHASTAAGSLAFLSSQTTEVMRLTSTGRVGIGTTSPGFKVDVRDSGRLGIAIRSSDNNAANGSASLYLGNASEGGAIGYDNNEIIIASINDINLSQTRYKAISISATYDGGVSATAAALSINSTGNIGIGTTTPSFKLQLESSVNGNDGIYARNTNTGSSASSFVSVNSSVGQLLLRAHSATHAIWPNATVISSDAAFTAGLAISQSGTNPISFYINGSERARFNGSGNFGIGTATPTSKLQVVGLPVHVDNAAAITAGLTAGAFYHAGDGLVRVVF